MTIIGGGGGNHIILLDIVERFPLLLELHHNYECLCVLICLSDYFNLSTYQHIKAVIVLMTFW